MTAKPPSPPVKFKTNVDTSVLSQDEIAELQLEVEEQVRSDRKAAAKDQVRAEMELDAKQSVGLAEEMVEVYVDLAPYCDRVLLDNKAFLQGRSYTVRASVAQVIAECAQRSWRHQAEIDGKTKDFYQRHRNMTLSPSGVGGGVINTAQGLRA